MPVTDGAARRFVARYYGLRVTGLPALGAGEWSRAYAMALDGHPPRDPVRYHVEDFHKDQVMAAHSSAALPVPAVIEIGGADDGYFAVCERAAGQLLDRLDEPGMRAVIPGLLAALDAIRQIGGSGSWGYGIRAPDGIGPAASWPQALLAINQETTRVPGWRAALQRFPASARYFDLAYARLRDLAAGLLGERHVIPGDLLNRNVLVQGSQITAVIDWGNAGYGDWLYDAAWLIYWWPWFPRWRAIDISAELRHHWDQDGLPPGLDHRFHACQLHIGMDALTYNAFRGRRDDLARNTEQLGELIKE